ncbi:ribbon-helix-helix protein, CopG family [Gulosibacter sp. 10]|uniref:ribbon-helix-helix protein, CopG family n=1 Tax=Gulosibacter sp. 10 TaxID=1255570 RepID=UPI00097F08C4|nr:ribbon-helix-helix protein, CopG family [Gulosibacter sp. 10]SJM61134.1 hypothetical protein FM112_07670 [Gulosibacter sp. 10]
MAVRKVVITLPEELYAIVERAREVEQRTRSEVVQEALRTYFGEPVYVPSDEERRALALTLDEVAEAPARTRDWDRVRADLHAER